LAQDRRVTLYLLVRPGSGYERATRFAVRADVSAAFGRLIWKLSNLLNIPRLRKANFDWWFASTNDRS
jgi:hypothetical protein